MSGMRMEDSEYTDLFHNSILLNSSNGSCLDIISSINFDGENRILNNIIGNKGTGSVINISVNSNDLDHITSMDYNNFYYSNTAILGIFNSDSVNNIKEWNSLTSMDAHSINENPFF